MNGAQMAAFTNGAGVNAAVADYFFAALFAAAVLTLIAVILVRGYAAWVKSTLRMDAYFWMIGGSVTVASMGMLLIR